MGPSVAASPHGETPSRPAIRSGILVTMPTTDRADLVLTGGQVFTAEPAASWAEAIAVRGDRIVAVGGDREVMALAGPSTRVIALRGRTVTPGFGDAHVHPISSGVDRLHVDLVDSSGIDEY